MRFSQKILPGFALCTSFLKISIFVTFPDIQSDCCYAHNFYQHKEQGPAELPDTLNIVVKVTENFLEAFEKKKIQIKTWGFLIYFSWLWVSLLKFLASFAVPDITVTIFLPSQRTKSSRRHIFFERFRQHYRKSSIDNGKRSNSKHEKESSKPGQNILTKTRVLN